MKISTKLEEMVADLVSDAQRERDEVEAVLGQIAVLVESFKERAVPITIHAPDQPDLVPPTESGRTVEREPQQDTTSLDAQLQNMVAFNLKMGDDKETAERKARMALGVD